MEQAGQAVALHRATARQQTGNRRACRQSRNKRAGRRADHEDEVPEQVAPISKPVPGRPTPIPAGHHRDTRPHRSASQAHRALVRGYRAQGTSRRAGHGLCAAAGRCPPPPHTHTHTHNTHTARDHAPLPSSAPPAHIPFNHGVDPRWVIQGQLPLVRHQRRVGARGRPPARQLQGRCGCSRRVRSRRVRTRGLRRRSVRGSVERLHRRGGERRRFCRRFRLCRVCARGGGVGGRGSTRVGCCCRRRDGHGAAARRRRTKRTHAPRHHEHDGAKGRALAAPRPNAAGESRSDSSRTRRLTVLRSCCQQPTSTCTRTASLSRDRAAAASAHGPWELASSARSVHATVLHASCPNPAWFQARRNSRRAPGPPKHRRDV